MNEQEKTKLNNEEFDNLDIEEIDDTEVNEIEDIEINEDNNLEVDEQEIEKIVKEADELNNSISINEEQVKKPSELIISEKIEDKKKEINTSENKIEEKGKKVSLKELTEKSELKNIIEAILFVSGRPLGSDEISVKIEINKKQVEELIKELAFEYQERNTSIEIVQIGDKFSMQIKPKYNEHIKKFASGGLIPEAIMRTLTIIALKQPLSKSILVKLRGSGAYQHIKFLLDRGLINEYKKGKSSIVETTPEFSDMFGLPRDKQKLKEQLKDILKIEGEIKSGDQEAEEIKLKKEKLKEAIKQKNNEQSGEN